MKRPGIPLMVLGGGAVGWVAGAAYARSSGAAEGVFVLGGLGFGLGLVLGSIVGGTWLLLATLLTWGKPDGPAADYDDAPPPGEALMADRRIVGFHQDPEGHWVAELDCGHDQHVRHDPPWMNRPWVVTPEGRAGRLGVALTCVKCDSGRPPDRRPPG